MFEVFDDADAAVTTLVDGDFTKSLFLDAAVSVVTVTISHIGSGRYVASWTPNATGYWHLHIQQATGPAYNVRGFSSDYDVTTDGIPSVAANAAGVLQSPSNKLATDATGRVTVASIATNAITAASIAADALTSAKIDATVGTELANALLDLSSAVDGKTLRQTLKLMGAALCGKAAGGPANLVYKGMDGVSDRITSVSDANGNRTSVVLSP
jgi:hypothetical protein